MERVGRSEVSEAIEPKRGKMASPVNTESTGYLQEGVGNWSSRTLQFGGEALDPVV